MARPDSEPTIEAAIKVLTAVGTSQHYKALTELMQADGWVYNGNSKDVSYGVYAMLYTEGKNAQRVVFIGRGHFGLPWMKEAEGAANRKQRKTSAVQQEVDEHERRQQEEDDQKMRSLPRMCGTCKHMSFHGIHIATQRIGDCDIDDKSGRPYPFPGDEACPYYRPQTLAQRRSQQEKQHETVLLIEAFNAGVHKGRRSKS